MKMKSRQFLVDFTLSCTRTTSTSSECAESQPHNLNNYINRHLSPSHLLLNHLLSSPSLPSIRLFFDSLPFPTAHSPPTIIMAKMNMMEMDALSLPSIIDPSLMDSDSDDMDAPVPQLSKPKKEKKACRYYLSKSGCKNGDSCAFHHDDDKKAAKERKIIRHEAKYFPLPLSL